MADRLPRARGQARALRVPRATARPRPRSGLPARRDPAARRGERAPASRSPASATSPRPGSCRCEEFYGALADRVLPLDPVHPPLGGAALHARAGPDPRGDRAREPAGVAGVAELNLLAGRPRAAARPRPALKFLAHVFWFTIEFGVAPRGGRAARLRRRDPLELRRDRGVPRDGDPAARLPGDGHHRRTTSRSYQPVLYSAESMTHLMESLGGFFAGFDDDTPEPALQARGTHLDGAGR